MNARKIFVSFSLLTIAMMLVAACGAPAAAPTAAPQAAAQAPQPAAPAQPAEAPAAESADSAAGQNLPVSTGVQASPYQQNRMIIKNGEMTLLVADTDRAIDQATSVAVDSGGYVVSSKTWLQDGYKYAALTMGIPSDQFEVAQRRRSDCQYLEKRTRVRRHLSVSGGLFSSNPWRRAWRLSNDRPCSFQRSGDV